MDISNEIAEREQEQAREKAARRQLIESQLKDWVRNWGKLPELPPAPALPPDFSPHLTFMYETFNKRIERLDERLMAIYKLAFRTSAALLGLALPTLGPNAITNILRLLGSN